MQVPPASRMPPYVAYCRELLGLALVQQVPCLKAKRGIHRPAAVGGGNHGVQLCCTWCLCRLCAFGQLQP